MLESLFNLIKENSTEEVINNPIIPNEKNDAVIADATHSVVSELQGVLAGGGLQNVLSFFNNGSNNTGGSGLLNNPIVSNIISNFTNKLTSNHGIPGDQAGNIANSLIPNVLSNLINKTNDPNNSSFDIGSIISSITGSGAQAGGGNFDLSGIVSSFTNGGLDANNDGHVGIDDLISKLTSGAQQQQQGQPGGSENLMDMIKGFMK